MVGKVGDRQPGEGEGPRVKRVKLAKPEERVADRLLGKRSAEAAETGTDLSTKKVKKEAKGSAFSRLEPAQHLREELPQLARNIETDKPGLAKQLLSACESMNSEEEFYQALGPCLDRITLSDYDRNAFSGVSPRCENLVKCLIELRDKGKTASLTAIDSLARILHSIQGGNDIEWITREIARSQSEINDLFRQVALVCTQLPPGRQTHYTVPLIRSIPKEELSHARGDIVSLCRETARLGDLYDMQRIIAEFPESDRLEALRKIAQTVHDTPQGIAWDNILLSLRAFPQDLKARFFPKLLELFQGLDKASADKLGAYFANVSLSRSPRSFFVKHMPDLFTQLGRLRKAVGIKSSDVIEALIRVKKGQRADVVRYVCQIVKDIPECRNNARMLISAIENIAPIERQNVVSFALVLSHGLTSYSVSNIIRSIALVPPRERRDVVRQALSLLPFCPEYDRSRLVDELSEINRVERAEVADITSSLLRGIPPDFPEKRLVFDVVSCFKEVDPERRREFFSAFGTRLAAIPDAFVRTGLATLLVGLEPQMRERLYPLLLPVLQRFGALQLLEEISRIVEIKPEHLPQAVALFAGESTAREFAKGSKAFSALPAEKKAYLLEHQELIQGATTGKYKILKQLHLIPQDQLQAFVTPLIPLLQGLNQGEKRALMLDLLFNCDPRQRETMQSDLQQLFRALSPGQIAQLYDSLDDVHTGDRATVLRSAQALLRRARTEDDVDEIIRVIHLLNEDERERILAEPQVQDAQSLARAYNSLRGIQEEVEPRQRGESYKITAIAKEIEERPEQYLETLSREFTPNKNHLSVEFEGQSGIDAGGLGRDFVSQLFSSLATKMGCKEIGKSDLFRPILHMSPDGQDFAYSEADKKRDFQLGQMLMFCLNAAEDYPTGTLFDEGVFVAILGFNEGLLQEEFAKLDPKKPELFNELFAIFEKMNAHVAESELKSVLYAKQFLKPLPEEAEDKKEFLERLYSLVECEEGVEKHAPLETLQGALRTMIFRTVFRPNLEPLFEIAKGMKQSPFSARYSWQSLHTLEPHQLSERLQGVITPQSIVGKLQFDQRIPQEKQQWFKEWISTTSDEKRKRFLAAITGSKALGRKGIIINLAPHVMSPIYYHTCFNTVDFPFSAITSAESFREALENSLLIESTYDRA